MGGSYSTEIVRRLHGGRNHRMLVGGFNLPHYELLVHTILISTKTKKEGFAHVDFTDFKILLATLLLSSTLRNWASLIRIVSQFN